MLFMPCDLKMQSVQNSQKFLIRLTKSKQKLFHLRLERSAFLKKFKKRFFMLFSFLLKRSFQGIFSCLEILDESG